MTITTPTPTPTPISKPLVALRTRRRLLAMGAGAMAAAVAGARSAAFAQEATRTVDLPAPDPNCTVTPEQTSGPYYLPGQAIRQEIAEDRAGIPFRLRIGVTDVAACAMLPGVAVEIWHCDADATYSGVDGAIGSPTFLRGVQITDDAGVAEFHTIYPGWYPGRTTHIHLSVSVGGAAGPAADDPQAVTTDAGVETYQGGREVLVGQIYVDDAVSDVVYALPPYNARDGSQRTRNDQDRIYRGIAGQPGTMIAVRPVDDADWTMGLIGEVVLGVDPA